MAELDVNQRVRVLEVLYNLQMRRQEEAMHEARKRGWCARLTEAQTSASTGCKTRCRVDSGSWRHPIQIDVNHTDEEESNAKISMAPQNRCLSLSLCALSAPLRILHLACNDCGLTSCSEGGGAWHCLSISRETGSQSKVSEQC